MIIDGTLIAKDIDIKVAISVGSLIGILIIWAVKSTSFLWPNLFIFYNNSAKTLKI